MRMQRPPPPATYQTEGARHRDHQTEAFPCGAQKRRKMTTAK